MDKIYCLQYKSLLEVKMQLFHRQLTKKLWFLVIVLRVIVKKADLKGKSQKNWTLGLKTPLSKVPILMVFVFDCIKYNYGKIALALMYLFKYLHYY